jgi:hypothetical protein
MSYGTQTFPRFVKPAATEKKFTWSPLYASRASRNSGNGCTYGFINCFLANVTQNVCVLTLSVLSTARSLPRQFYTTWASKTEVISVFSAQHNTAIVTYISAIARATYSQQFCAPSTAPRSIAASIMKGVYASYLWTKLVLPFLSHYGNNRSWEQRTEVHIL